MHIIERIHQPPPPPISLDKIQLESLTQNVVFLQDFLERYPHDGSEEADELESRIRDAAYAAEDVLESHILDQIAGRSTSSHGEKISSIDKVIEEMGFIKKEVMDIKERRGIKNIQLNRNSMPSDSLRSPSTGPNSMVGFDDLLYEIMDKLTGVQHDRQIIPIYGMGGIGVFEEDCWISVSLLIKLWVAEEFIKPISSKRLEAVAEEYLQDLIDRNLIFIRKRECEIKLCNIHDLLRDLCLRQAQREKFICVASQCNPDIPQGISTQRRVAVRRSTCNQALQSLQSMSLVRSLIYNFDADLPLLDFRLLRVLTASDENFDIEKAKFLDSLEAIFSQLMN